MAHAFDDMHPEISIVAMEAAQVNPNIIFAIIRENLDVTCTPDFQGERPQEEIPFSKSGKQGGVETPYLVNGLIRLVFSDLHSNGHINDMAFL